jgi:hypothetical protein
VILYELFFKASRMNFIYFRLWTNYLEGNVLTAWNYFVSYVLPVLEVSNCIKQSHSPEGSSKLSWSRRSLSLMESESLLDHCLKFLHSYQMNFPQPREVQHRPSYFISDKFSLMVFPFYLRLSFSSGFFALDSPITVFPFLAYLQHVPLLSFIATLRKFSSSLAIPFLYICTFS